MTRKLLLLLLSLGGIYSLVQAQKPVYELVERIQQGASNRFLFEITSNQGDEDYFVIDQKNDKIWISGNNNVSLATGLNWYLKYHAGIHLSWNSFNHSLDCLPRVTTRERHATKQLVRFYFNYCTFSYSMAFWDWKRWEQEIDFMAMHGINLPLAITGTSVVWRNTLIALGYDKNEATAFIASPAHQAWWLMNNLEGSDEQVLDSYFEHEEMLQKKIISRYKQWGIEPVLPGYGGMIPRNAQDRLGLNIQDPGLWCGYPRPAFLQPEDSRFSEIATTYYQELTKLYGEANYYSIDPFHEGGSTSGVDLEAAGKAIYGAMKQANDCAVWVVQSWQSTPYQKMIDVVPAGDVLVLDLFSESRPQWGDPQSTWYRQEGFGKHNWIYCMLLNFGGNTGMYGKMDRLIDGYYLAKESKQGQTLVGVGATPEGIENNPVMYELLFELPWRTQKFTKEEWLETWISARYGASSPQLAEVWRVLSNTVYMPPYLATQEGTTESVLCAKPSLKVDRVSSWATAQLYYEPKELEKALGWMVEVADKYQTSENFRYDLVDLSRQIIANRGNQTLPLLQVAFEKGDFIQFEKHATDFLHLILLQDRITSAHSSFMVGTWLESAQKMAANSSEIPYYRNAAARLITTWGNRYAANEGGLRDYSHREWSGLLRDVYYERWTYFFDYIIAKKTLPEIDYYDMENSWITADKCYETVPITDAIEVAREVQQLLLNSIN
ncbi:MAG: alpha-N-acetylglucosaminidase [Phocaeicola sp.]